MTTTRRRVALALTAAASAGTVLLGAAPAGAAAAPAWPSTGRVPTGCDPGVVFTNPTADTWTYQFYDHTTPQITSARVSSGSRNLTVLKPTGARVVVSVTASDPCSGVGSVLVDIARDGSIGSLGGALSPASTNAFAGGWTKSLGTLHPDDAGVYTVPVAVVAHRYDDFTLDQDFRMVTHGSAAGTDTVTGSWALSKSYILRYTTLSSSAPTSISRGTTATARGVIKFATNAGYNNGNGEKVLVQVRTGTSGRWYTKATRYPRSGGRFSYSFKPSRTSQVRFVHPTDLGGRHTAMSVSAVRTIVVR
ncbi:MAG: hypothetical protein GC157_06165 [Frankiales bacterium]|nr:hypothetical protein [Frankiales bacterium]